MSTAAQDLEHAIRIGDDEIVPDLMRKEWISKLPTVWEIMHKPSPFSGRPATFDYTPPKDLFGIPWHLYQFTNP